MPGPKSTRKRTEAQRKSAKEEEEDSSAAELVEVVQDEQEQEAEIDALKVKEASDNRVWRTLLDILVTVCIVICASQTINLFNQPTTSLFLRLLSLAQTLTLPLSLTPTLLPRFQNLTSKYHSSIMMIQMALFISALSIIRRHNVALGANLDWADMLRWALPEMIAGAVEVQRRGESQARAEIEALDGKRYKLKGA